MKIHLLIGLKLTGNRKRTGQIATHDRDNRGRSRLLGRSFAIVTYDKEGKSCQEKTEKHRDPKDPLTMHGATLTFNPGSSGSESTTVRILKGTGDRQQSYSMSENRPGLQ